GVPGHPRGVGGFEAVAGAAMHTRRLHNIGDVFGIIDAIELVFEGSGNIHLDELDIVGHCDATSCHMRCTIAMPHTGPSLRCASRSYSPKDSKRGVAPQRQALNSG